MVAKLVQWPREKEGAPFDTAAFNRLMNFLIGDLAAPFKLVQVGGNLALSWDPALDLLVIRASSEFHATLTLGNTIWLDGYKAGNTVPVHLVRVNSSDIIELGASDQRMSIGAALTNNTSLSGRNAANSASITLVKLNTSNIVELGAAGQQSNLMGTTNVIGALQANGAGGTSTQVWHGGATPAYGSVATADIATDAITQIESPTPTTSSPSIATVNTWGSINEMSATITSTGGKLLAQFSGSFYNTAAHNATIGLSLDGAAEVAERTVSLTAGSLAQEISTMHLFTGVAAGSRNVLARWKTAGGTLSNHLLQRTLILTEIKR